jgi:hypothetical protein
MHFCRAKCKDGDKNWLGKTFLSVAPYTQLYIGHLAGADHGKMQCPMKSDQVIMLPAHATIIILCVN